MRYSTYNKEFYAVVQSLGYWRHYLLPKEFIIFSDHEALKYLNSQQKLNARHARWVEYLQSYTFVLKHKVGSENRAADALSRRVTLLFTSQVEVLGFERIKEEYKDCLDFENIYTNLTSHRSLGEYILQGGYLFKEAKLCIPRTSVRNFLIWELHAGGLAGHFGVHKIITLVEE